METIDIVKTFSDNHCSFTVAKQLREKTNLKPDRFDLAYDEQGAVSDGQWLENIVMGIKYYSAPSLCQAILLLESLPGKNLDQFEFKKLTGMYVGKFNGDIVAEAEKLVDVILMLYIKLYR